MTSCSQAEVVIAWAKRGSDSALDWTIERHLETCRECHELFQEITLVRAVAKELPVHDLSRDKRDALRFTLMAEARRGAGRRRSSWPAAIARRPLRRRLAWAAAAAAILAAGFGGALGLRTTPDSIESAANVVLLPGAEGASEHAAPDEIYRLSRGTADFAVKKLGEQRRYRVLAGDGTVEVRGTRFRLDVAEGQLRTVEVSEGEVWVWLDGTLVADLQKGERWARGSETSVSSAVSGAPLAETPPVVEPSTPGVSASPSAQRTESSTARSARTEPSSGKPSSVASFDAPAPPPAVSAREPNANGDSGFAHAWDLFKRGESLRAASEFDTLLSSKLDNARRADVLYWAAQAYARAGRPTTAESRARRLANEFGSSFRAADAALMLGEMTLARGDRAEAREWFRRAALSSHPAVRARADKALADLGSSR